MKSPLRLQSLAARFAAHTSARYGLLARGGIFRLHLVASVQDNHRLSIVLENLLSPDDSAHLDDNALLPESDELDALTDDLGGVPDRSDPDDFGD